MNNIKERPECRRDRYNRNSECDKARLRRAEDPEKMRKSTAASLRWQKENREAALVIKRNRRARKIAADGNHSASDIAAIRAVQKDRCACCRKKLDLKGHVDHIHPLARGGSNWPRNLQLLCERCNCTKSARDPIEFMRSQGFLI
jgi:5-methylcytosine-specific restriction endonuclease McrA